MENTHYKSIKTIDAALAAKGYDLAQVEEMFAAVPDELRKGIIKTFTRELIISAINGTWKADYSNRKQKKWFPWYVVQNEEPSPAVGLSLDVCRYDRARASVGPRHTFETEEQARHYATYFREFDEQYYSQNN